jgi:hypothetical protein
MPFVRERDFTLKLFFYEEKQNECLKKIIQGAFEAQGFKTVKIADKGFMEISVFIKSDIGM